MGKKNEVTHQTVKRKSRVALGIDGRSGTQGPRGAGWIEGRGERGEPREEGRNHRIGRRRRRRGDRRERSDGGAEARGRLGTAGPEAGQAEDTKMGGGRQECS